MTDREVISILKTAINIFEDISFEGVCREDYKLAINTAIDSIRSLSLIEDIISAQEASEECQGYVEFSELEAYNSIKEILRKENAKMTKEVLNSTE